MFPPMLPPKTPKTFESAMNFLAYGGCTRVLLVSTRNGIPLELVEFNLIQVVGEGRCGCDKERTGNPPPGGFTAPQAH